MHRQQRTVSGGQESNWLSVLSGFPQGSILGPLLFSLYINDMPTSIIDSLILLYADDTKCYREISSLLDCYRLQLDLNLLHAWSIVWKLHFNPRKCKALSVTHSKSPIIFDYSMHTSTIERVDCMKDLGVVIDSNLSWNKHIQGTVSKANRVFWLLKRALGFNAPSSVSKQLYESFVRSLLEYCPQVWSGTTKRNVRSLERVQRSATRFIMGYPELDYKERLSHLNMLPLSYRREYLDVCFLFKCFNLDYNVDISQFVNVTNGGRLTRGNNVTNRLLPVMCRTEGFKRSYFNRIVNTWNLLPEECRVSLDTVSFKRTVNDFYVTLFTDKFESNNMCTWCLKCNFPCCAVR